MVNISACVIVKNEAENLPRWLECMQVLADEMVVVDTGSTDDTIAIAKQAGAKVYEFPWCNDFAKAKNFALSKAKGKWILFLDADEYILATDFTAVRDLIRRYDKNRTILGFMCRLVNIDVDNNNQYLNDGYQIRFFRHLPNLQYTGAIHEVLQYKGKDKCSMELVRDFTIYHTGYSAHIIQQKLQRNIKLLLAKQGTSEYRDGDDYYLGDCYYGLKEYEKVVTYISRAIQNKVKVVGNEVRMYAILIQSLIFLNRPEDEVQAAIVEAEKKLPQAPELAMLAGQDSWKRKKYQAAEKAYRKCLEMYQAARRRAQDNNMESDEMQSLLPQIYCNLGCIERMKKRETEAAALFIKALSHNKYHVESLQNFFRSVAPLADVDLIQWLNQHYDQKADAAFIVQALPERGCEKVYLYYARQGHLPEKEWHNYLLAGKLKAAAAALTEELDSLYRLAIVRGKHDDSSKKVLTVLLPEVYQKAIAHPQQPVEFRIARKLQRMRNDLQEE